MVLIMNKNGAGKALAKLESSIKESIAARSVSTKDKIANPAIAQKTTNPEAIKDNRCAEALQLASSNKPAGLNVFNFHWTEEDHLDVLYYAKYNGHGPRPKNWRPPTR